jgi:hypothetical protein
MKPLLLLLAVSFGFPAAAQTNEHPIIHQLVTSADVIAVAWIRDPQFWFTSELIVMTGQSTALVERTLKGEKLPLKITVGVVRHLDIESLVLERPQEPSPKGRLEVPVTPAIPSKFTTVDDTDRLKSADKVIVFLRRGKDGTLSAIDGFLYTLPYSLELEGVVSAAAKNQAQQGADGNRPQAPQSPDKR